MTRRIWVLVGAALVIAAGAGLVGLEAGRRNWPERLANRLGIHAPVVPSHVEWSSRAEAPAPRYESGAIVIAGKVYLFSGFHERQIRALARIDVYDPVTNTWSRRADMPTPTTHRNPVLLGDTVWFAGGFLGDNPGPATAQVWKYDWHGDRWFPGPALPEPRGGGALIEVGGRLHYLGGYGPDRNLSESEHWILENTGWQPATPLPRPRGHFGAAVLNGELYVVGGTVRHDPVQIDVDWVDRFDPSAGIWREMVSLPEPTSHIESSIFVRKGRLIIIGGRNNTSLPQALDLALTYDPTTDSWLPISRVPDRRLGALGLPIGDSLYFGVGTDTRYLPWDSRIWAYSLNAPWHRLADLPVPLSEVTATAINNELWLVGDGSAYTLRYDVATDRWDPPGTLATRPVGGHHHGGEWLDGKWYLVGGLGSSEVGRILQIYDPRIDRWSLGPDLPWNAGSAATAVIQGQLYVAGGIDGDSTVGKVARLDPHSGKWTQLAPMPLPRNHAASSTDGKRWYIFGGRGPGSGDGNVVANGFSETQIYDPATDRWVVSGPAPESPAPLPQARGGMGKAVYARGEFWVFGGETKDGPGATNGHVYDRVDIYDPVKNHGHPGPAMLTGRHGIFPILLGDRIYVIAGGIEAGHSSSRAVEYLDLDGVARIP